MKPAMPLTPEQTLKFLWVDQCTTRKAKYLLFILKRSREAMRNLAKRIRNCQTCQSATTLKQVLREHETLVFHRTLMSRRCYRSLKVAVKWVFWIPTTTARSAKHTLWRAAKRWAITASRRVTHTWTTTAPRHHKRSSRKARRDRAAARV